MPVSPEQSGIHKISQVELNRIMDEQIDSKLIDSKFMRDNHHTDGRMSYWEIILKREFSESEKSYICRSYLNVGWSHVSMENSSQNDERGGLCRFRVYRKTSKGVLLKKPGGESL